MMGDPVDWLIPTPIHLLLLLGVLSVAARSAAWRWAARAGFVWAWIGCTPAIANLLVVALEGSPAAAREVPPRDARTLIHVLASGQLRLPDGRVQARLDADGWERARGGVALWRQTGGTLLFSGGPSGDDVASIAAAMARVALDMGVPASAVRLSARGENTFAEMQAARAIIVANPGPRWLVTSARHMPRAMWTAGCLGIDTRPRPIGFRQIENVTWRSWWPDTATMAVYRGALHEWVGDLAYRARHRCGEALAAPAQAPLGPAAGSDGLGSGPAGASGAAPGASASRNAR